eukprot:CAMPEP_0198281824 /NCGR_PEP_ID=MMETSP1449-20131203/1700_1 /TAXON_ID=420275 /ORGANISM="Attheya septentrionalis, Strain CCMP2084" /LENGTH=280 /DNA_ID=CAMNT_0043977769 /DNA_START=14 /DNA_END=856 /DNA_ORIENTATION=+
MTGTLVCLLVGLMLVQARIGVDENALTQEERLLRGIRRSGGVRGDRSSRQNRFDGVRARRARPPKDEMVPTPDVEDEGIQDVEEEEEDVEEVEDAPNNEMDVLQEEEYEDVDADADEGVEEEDEDARYTDVTKTGNGGGFGGMSAFRANVCAEGDGKKQRRADAKDKCSSMEQCIRGPHEEIIVGFQSIGGAPCWEPCRESSKKGHKKCDGDFKCVTFVNGCTGEAHVTKSLGEGGPPFMGGERPEGLQMNGGPPGGLQIHGGPPGGFPRPGPMLGPGTP